MDPDILLRRHVFQPIVDRFEIDPRTGARTLHRFSLIGGVGGLAGLVWALVSLLAMLDEPLWKAAVAPLPVLCSFALQARQIMRPPVMSMDPFSASQRLLWIVMAVLMLCMVAILPPMTPMLVRLAGTAVAISWTTGICAVYVNLCRKPPKRPRREKVAKRMAARA